MNNTNKKEVKKEIKIKTCCEHCQCRCHTEKCDACRDEAKADALAGQSEYEAQQQGEADYQAQQEANAQAEYEANQPPPEEPPF